jgi:tripeptide aminopeptidase
MKKFFFIAAAFIAFTAFTTIGNWTNDDPHSQLGFTVTHLGISDISGTFNDFDVTITSSKPDFSDAVFEMSAKTASIDTRVEARNNHLKSADFFDVEKFAAQWGYTMDGSQIGELEYENFNAAGAKITFKGKSVHPGYAKGKMINSMLIANDFINELPKGETPQETKGYEGFFHVHHLTGSIEETVLELIIRDHNKKKFEKRKDLIGKITKKINRKFAKQFGEDIVIAEVKDQYYNMKEKVLPVKHIVDIAEKAMRELNIKPIIKPIRGGTDGSQLSYMGLPCPNIFAGGHNFHGKYEYVPAESIQKATDVIVKIAELTAIQGAFDVSEKPKRKK